MSTRTITPARVANPELLNVEKLKSLRDFIDTEMKIDDAALRRWNQGVWSSRELPPDIEIEKIDRSIKDLERSIKQGKDNGYETRYEERALAEHQERRRVLATREGVCKTSYCAAGFTTINSGAVRITSDLVDYKGKVQTISQVALKVLGLPSSLVKSPTHGEVDLFGGANDGPMMITLLDELIAAAEQSRPAQPVEDGEKIDGLTDKEFKAKLRDGGFCDSGVSNCACGATEADGVRMDRLNLNKRGFRYNS